MNRVASTFALSCWLGFTAVSALLAAARETFGLAIPLPESASAAVPALLLAFSAMLLSLLYLHGKGIDRRGRGEWLGMAGLLLVAGIAGAGLYTGRQFLAVDAAGATFWLLLALGIAALVFDRMTSVEDGPDEDDEAFSAALAAITRATADRSDGGAGSSVPGRGGEAS